MPTKSNKAFTLVEVMIATTMATVAMAAIMTFYVQTLKAGYVTQQQIALQGTLRSLTSELLVHASRAHTTVLYNSPAAADRNTESDRREFGYDASDAPINPTGNLVVFVYFQIPKDEEFARHPITKLVGYYTETVDADAPRLTRVTIELDDPSNESFEDILTTHWDGTASGATVVRKVFAPRVIPLALSSNDPLSPTTPQLFYKSSQETVAVCGQLLASAAGRNTGNRYTHTRTFFFTVSVRS